MGVCACVCTHAVHIYLGGGGEGQAWMPACVLMLPFNAKFLHIWTNIHNASLVIRKFYTSKQLHNCSICVYIWQSQHWWNWTPHKPEPLRAVCNAAYLSLSHTHTCACIHTLMHAHIDTHTHTHRVPVTVIWSHSLSDILIHRNRNKKWMTATTWHKPWYKKTAWSTHIQNKAKCHVRPW